MARNTGSIDEDPGWSDVDKWVRPKVPRDEIRKLLREKHERVAQEQESDRIMDPDVFPGFACEHHRVSKRKVKYNSSTEKVEHVDHRAKRSKNSQRQLSLRFASTRRTGLDGNEWSASTRGWPQHIYVYKFTFLEYRMLFYLCFTFLYIPGNHKTVFTDQCTKICCSGFMLRTPGRAEVASSSSGCPLFEVPFPKFKDLLLSGHGISLDALSYLPRFISLA